MKDIGDKILKGDQLLRLVQEENFVGWIYTIDYDTAQVMTSDLWKIQALGVPHNCFLVAASFNPNEFSNVDPKEREIILLRVVSSAKLPQDDDLVRAKIDRFQIQKQKYDSTASPDYDDITLNQMQFHGLKCRVLGTFYTKNDQLWLGSDLESFVSAASFNVYRPRQDALKMIANYVDPIRLSKAAEEMQQFGIQNTVSPFPIGTVRYTSTDRLHRSQDAEKVPVSIQPTDFLARRTAVLGMTRTGKSNMVKQMVSVVKRVANEGGIKIGQIIYDINGEYANANQQDKGAIADVFPDTVRYRMLDT
jgi:Helicase HerA, central domain